MNNTIDVHAQFRGIVADTIDQMIKTGRAASRTEAIRLAILHYNEHFGIISQEKERKGWKILTEKSLCKVWDNPKDEAAARQYVKLIKGDENERKKKRDSFG
jgi:Arc/MetJ-type ribon-helix-helix transcriptional regulator